MLKKSLIALIVFVSATTMAGTTIKSFNTLKTDETRIYPNHLKMQNSAGIRTVFRQGKLVV